MKNCFEKIGALLLAIPFILGLAGSAQAYRLIGAIGVDGTFCAGDLLECGDADVFARWWNYPVAYWVNVDASADAGDPGLTQAAILGIAQDSYQSWEDVPFSVITFAYQGETSARLAGTDGHNTLVWYNGLIDAGACAGVCGVAGGTLAITILTEIGESGEIIDADIVMDSADPWETDASCGDYDVQSVLTHEYGHSIGIHHTELAAGSMATRPTMYAYYFCDAGIASGRTLEPDDEAAAQCLYPELPTVLLVDQTGSMCTGDRMVDAQGAANAFVDAYASNILAVAAFAEGTTGECGGCAARPGYELYQDWTDDAALLHAAINSTSACGFTPLWESVCCAIDKAEENEPSNLFILTDTGENSSDGTCGCIDFSDVLASAEAADDVVVYVLDMTNYFGSGTVYTPAASLDEPADGPRDQSQDLETLCGRTGGLYVRADNEQQLYLGRLAIQEHMAEKAKINQRPPTCNPGPYPVDNIQTYRYPTCAANSPYLGEQVVITGVVTAMRGTWDASTQYVQDCSGGIQVFGNVGPIGQLGDEVMVTGVVSESFGELRISPVQQYVIRAPKEVPPTAIVDPATGHVCELIGSLLSVRGFVAGPVSNFRFPLVSDLGAQDPQKLTVFIDPDTDINPADIKPGDHYIVTGLLTQRLGENELKPRGMSDFELVSPADVEPVSPVSGVMGSGISAIHPNPLREATAISYQVTAKGHVSVEIFDVQGRLVRTLADAELSPGPYAVEWDARNESGATVPSGLYFVRFAGPEGARHSKHIAIMR